MPSSCKSRFTVFSVSFTSKGSATSTLQPMASKIPWMFMGSAGVPMAVRPVPGWGWKPVMAVAELSSTISSMLALWYTVTTFWSRPYRVSWPRASARLMPEPMQLQAWKAYCPANWPDMM